MSKRVSLILADLDEQAIAPFLTGGTEQHVVLQRWAAQRGSAPVRTEASALRALLQVAVETLRDDVLEAGYADLATTYHATPDRAERRAARDRYVARTDAAL